MKNFDYQKTYKFARAFYELNPLEVEIMDYLFQYDIVEMSINKLAKAIGKDVSNIRKALIKLNNRGIVCIVNKYTEDELKENNIKHNTVEAMYIVDNWIDNLLNSQEV